MTSKLEAHLSSISTSTPKQLRTLRNSLNNRIKAMLERGEENAKPLSESHRLYGLMLGDCQKLLKQVQVALKEIS
jgi:hypothetical protein